MTATSESSAPDVTTETTQLPPEPEDGDTPRTPSMWQWMRHRRSELDLRNTWQVVAGAILLPLGVAVIILGWHGAAYGNVDQKQIPYLISGGILGLAVVIVGCFFFWAHWLYRIYDQADLHHQEAMREQAELIKALLEAVGPRPGYSPAIPSHDGGANNGHTGPASYGADAVPSTPAVTYLATPTGTNFHTSGCPMIANRMDRVRTVSAGEAEQMRPCRICEPLKH